MGGSARGRGGRDVDPWDMREGRAPWREREGELETTSCEVVFAFLMVVRVSSSTAYAPIDSSVATLSLIADRRFICAVACAALLTRFFPPSLRSQFRCIWSSFASVARRA